MKHKIKKAILSSMTIGILLSCATTGKISVQIAVPPQNPLSPDIQSIAILNRSFSDNSYKMQYDSVENMLVNDNLTYTKTFSDTVAADTVLNVVAKAIYDSQYFDVVVPLQRNILRDDKEDAVTTPLDTTFINLLCKDFNVDGVLVLENFSEKVNRTIRVLPSGSRAIYKGMIDLAYDSNWRFYQPKQNPAFINYWAGDDLFWQSPGYYYTSNEMDKKLPTIRETLITGAHLLGGDMANLICPIWVDATRKYYITRNKKIDAAIPMIKLNKWDEAFEIWKNFASEPTISLRSKIESNLALVSEMKGNLDQAIEWGEKSLKSNYSRNTELYLLNLSRHSINQNRYYYTTGNPEIDAAVALIKLNKWDKAAEIWKKYYPQPDKMMCGKIEYNLALAEEMQDHIDLALKWGDKSLKTNNLRSTKQYLDELKQQSHLTKVAKNSKVQSTKKVNGRDYNLMPWLPDGSTNFDY